MVVQEGNVAPGAARGLALVGEDSALLAATPSGAVSCHTWPLHPSATGVVCVRGYSYRAQAAATAHMI